MTLKNIAMSVMILLPLCVSTNTRNPQNLRKSSANSSPRGNAAWPERGKHSLPAPAPA